MRQAFVILIMIMTQASCTGQTTIDIDKNEVSDKTTELVKQYEDLGIFSGVVMIARNGQPFYTKAFGLANRETKTSNRVETAFNIGSMNKDFTRIIILQLIEEGKLSFNDKMVNILDGFQQKHAGKITIAHLMYHKSGFGDYYSPAYWNLPYENRNIQGILPLLQNLPIHFEPGTGNRYSNAGYIILGAIIQKITGKTYAENVQLRIADPLAMKSLVTGNVKANNNRSIGYLLTTKGYENNEAFIAEPRSDGGFYANVTDMLNFYQEYFYGIKLLSERTRQQDEFFQKIKPVFGKKGAGIPLAGGFNGANTVIMEIPSGKISILVFANMDEPVAEKLASGIQKIVNNTVPGKPQLPALLNVYQAYIKSGAGYVKANFETLTSNWFEGDPKDLILNNLGYDLLGKGKPDEALDIFRINTELFPNIGNCWDSYGEALLVKGNKEAALIAYKKALSINPDIPTAIKAVKELEAKR